ncbi:YchJ family protein [Nitrosomonas supralitoralis]|uniref:UPF0225 protein C7H79_14580 n=1 Tax=Nitrosomonas supralitoralis TaxID=2116706 RepID=A0A2P7NRZ6_9PROT|nr:YchJ family metal-binding protein [Nitrosomonas supralitoralis]PSJ16244.1 hypothetical protein C7H79_14580 [Nitrosomonas supralitoralis]
MNTRITHLKTLYNLCPCGNNKQYADCCNRYLNLDEIATTAEDLMRSRYTAYTLNYENYLLATWHPDTRPTSLGLTDQPPNKWLGLTIKRHIQSSENYSTIEFIARYKINGRAHRLHEISRFVREDGIWLYVDGDML